MPKKLPTKTYEVVKMDKIILKFMADLLYLKGIINYLEFEAIMEASTPEDLDIIIETIFTEGYSGYIRGEYRV